MLTASSAREAAQELATVKGYFQKAQCPVAETAASGNIDRLYWGRWNDYEHILVDGQEYAKIGERLYTKHAVERMQPSGNRYGTNIYQASSAYGNNYGRSVAPQYIEDVIRSTAPVIQENGNLSYISGTLQVITNSRGDVVTVITR